MNKVVILEGPDGSGKTTLARELQQRLEGHYYHEGPPQNGGDLFNHYYLKLLWALKKTNPVVFDRLYLGETIYGPVHRRHDRLGKLGVRLLNRVLSAYGGLHVVCLPPFKTCMKNVKAQPKEHDLLAHNKTQHGRVYGLYKKASKAGSYVVCDYTGADICGGIDSHDLAVMLRAQGQLPWGMVGSPVARFLVVGEQVNKKATAVDLPFMATNGSSGYLHECLAAAGFKESELAFINAITIDDTPRDLDGLTGPCFPHFRAALALGRRAEELCQAQGVPHHHLRHPSCARRFHFRDKAEYVKAMRRIRAEYKG